MTLRNIDLCITSCANKKSLTAPLKMTEDSTSMPSILSNVVDGISLPFPLLHCDGCDCEEDDCSSYKSIIIWVYMMMSNLLSHLADSYAIWLVPLLVIVWRYRWVAIRVFQKKSFFN